MLDSFAPVSAKAPVAATARPAATNRFSVFIFRTLFRTGVTGTAIGSAPASSFSQHPTSGCERKTAFSQPMLDNIGPAVCQLLDAHAQFLDVLSVGVPFSMHAPRATQSRATLRGLRGDQAARRISFATEQPPCANNCRPISAGSLIVRTAP